MDEELLSNLGVVYLVCLGKFGLSWIAEEEEEEKRVLTDERVGFGPLLSERLDLVDQVLIIQLIGHLFQVIQARFVRVHSFQLNLE